MQFFVNSIPHTAVTNMNLLHVHWNSVRSDQWDPEFVQCGVKHFGFYFIWLSKRTVQPRKSHLNSMVSLPVLFIEILTKNIDFIWIWSWQKVQKRALIKYIFIGKALDIMPALSVKSQTRARYRISLRLYRSWQSLKKIRLCTRQWAVRGICTCWEF